MECPQLFVDNIIKTMKKATEQDRAYGATWYSAVQDECRRIGLKTNLCYKVVAAVTAALSPHTKWERNILDAKKLIIAFIRGRTIDSFKVSSYNKDKLKAWKILIVNSCEGDYTPMLTGQKIRSFYNCIIGTDDVCIDRHAVSVIYGLRLSNTRISPKLYRQAQIAYTLASRNTKYTPAQLQAITWSVWRGAK